MGGGPCVRGLAGAVVPLAWLASAVPLATAQTAEDEMYVLYRWGSLRAGVARVDGLAAGDPRVTWSRNVPLLDAHGLGGIAHDATADRLVAYGFDGFDTQVVAVDPATGSGSSLFVDTAVVQMQDGDLDVEGRGYAQHVVSQELLRVDVPAATITPILDLGADAGAGVALAPDGDVYALDPDTVLQRIDVATGATTELGPTYLWGAVGIDFASDGRLYALMYGGQVYSVGLDDLDLTLVGFLPELSPDLTGRRPRAMTIVAPVPTGWSPACVLDTARLLPRGTGLVASGTIGLTATGLRPGAPAFVVLSDDAQSPVLSSAYRGGVCVRAPVVRAFESLGAADDGGRYDASFDFASFPHAGGATAIVAGESRVFQAWYRDVRPTTTSSFSSAVEVTFR